MKTSASVVRFSRAALSVLMVLAGTATAYATDAYNASTRVLTIPTAAIGGVTYSAMTVKVGTILSGPSGTSPNGSEDTYNPANGRLTVPAVTVGSATYYNVVVTVTSLLSIGSVSGADSFDGAHLTIASVGDGNTVYTDVVLAVGLSNLVSVAQGMPMAGQDQFYPSSGRLFIPAVQFGSKVYTNVTLNVTAQDLVAVGGLNTTPTTSASGDLHSYYVAGTYSTNDAGNADLDELEDFSVGGCAVAGSPCNYSAPTLTLASSGSPTGGTLAYGTDAGTFASNNVGALTAFEIPTLINLASANGSAWQGAISLNDLGVEMVAMETDANAVPGMRVGLVPAQGVSNASLASGYVFVGIATNPSGVAGDEGLIDGLLFDGNGGFTGTETSNTWNSNTRTGGIHPSNPGPSGTYSVAGNGTMTLTFATGVNAGSTFTGAMSGGVIVLTNLSSTQGPRALYVGIEQPTTGAASEGCANDPLQGPAFANGIFESVLVSYNNSVVQQLTFNNGSAPFTLTQGGGTINSGGVLSAFPSGDTATYTIDDTCFLTIPRQTDSLGNIFEYQLGQVSANGTIFVLSDFDTSGGGPQVSVGVRISNVDEVD